MTIGERIKMIRTEKLGLSQTDLADKLGVSKQTLYKYENGIVTNIPSDKIELLARIAGVSPSYIMGWDDSYYLDPAVADMAQQAYDDPDTRLLLDAKRDLSEEDLDTVVSLIKRLKKDSEQGGDF